MNPILVLSQDERDGRTALCAGLFRLLVDHQNTPFLGKPIRVNDGNNNQQDPDARFFTQLSSIPQPEGWPISLNLRDAQGGLVRSTREKIASDFIHAVEQTSSAIIEGPPAIYNGQVMGIAADLAETLDARVIFLLGYSSQLQAKSVLPFCQAVGDRLVGTVINGVPRYQTNNITSHLVPELESLGIKVLTVVPEARCMLGITVEELVSHLNGRLVSKQEKQNELVEHIMIGGLVLGSGVDYFNRYERKVVIVRGDRPDIQMVALKTETQCLVLTGGHLPIEYVEHVASEVGVALAIVADDTLTTIRRMNTLFQSANVHYPAKADCYAKLLSRVGGQENLAASLMDG
jgi:BioD-like phosphotransacetylase family protein